jgi:hypothetical protein
MKMLAKVDADTRARRHAFTRIRLNCLLQQPTPFHQSELNHKRNNNPNLNV